MRRYFYDSPPIVAKWLQKNANARMFQDSVFRSAFFAALKIDPQPTYGQLHRKILDMTISEQLKYSNNAHIEELFKQFSILHRHSKGRTMMINASHSTSTDLVDPDKFPIWDLKKSKPLYKSLWGNLMGKIRYDIGHQMIVRQSRVEHPAGGMGVYLILPLDKNKVKSGDFLGFVPGRIYQNYNDYQKVVLKDMKTYRRLPQHLHFQNGRILQFGDISIAKSKVFGLDVQRNQDVKIDATYHNPFALGHMINHPPPGVEANVFFAEMKIEKKYFPNYLLNFMPYEDYTANKKEFIFYGIFALKDIESKQQLYVNYNESHIYPIDEIPEWLIEPVKFSPIFEYLVKKEYQIPDETYWKVLQRKAMRKNAHLFDDYLKKTQFRPGKVQFEDDRISIQRMKLHPNNDEKEFK